MKGNMVFETEKDCFDAINSIDRNNLHCACVIFKSPMTGRFECRVGYFIEYFEAQQWLKDLYKFYLMNDAIRVFSCYMDGTYVEYN